MVQIDTNDPTFRLAQALHTGNYFELAKLTNVSVAIPEELAKVWEILEMETRNQHWVDLLQSENSDVQFVVAGAAHAFYSTGVLMLLKKKGWKIQQIDLDVPDFSQTLESDYLKFLKYHTADSGAMELLTVISSFLMLLLL